MTLSDTSLIFRTGLKPVLFDLMSFWRPNTKGMASLG
jgi:hypothetical protein